MKLSELDLNIGDYVKRVKDGKIWEVKIHVPQYQSIIMQDQTGFQYPHQVDIDGWERFDISDLIMNKIPKYKPKCGDIVWCQYSDNSIFEKGSIVKHPETNKKCVLTYTDNGWEILDIDEYYVIELYNDKDK